MSGIDAIVAARVRILEELHAAGVRAWGAAFLALSRDEYGDAMMCLALDRIHEGETRGYTRRKPPQPAALDVTKLQIGLE
jgi:hypothetical protein